MNLIERLGGYANAKNELKIYGILKTEYIQGIFKEDLVNSLLEYRKEHKFYEVGDLVTYKAYFKGVWREGFGKITEIDEDLEVVNIEENVGVAISEIEHATSEEIEAGRRL